MATDYPKIQVCFSTLNQMVNLLTLRMFPPEQLVYCTIEGSPENARWDKNFDAVVAQELKKPKITFTLDKNDLLAISNIEDKLAHQLAANGLSTPPLLWNITGGQRYYFLAAYELFKKRHDDFLCYVEGNTNRIILLKNANGNILQAGDIRSNIEVSIVEALKLMGFKQGTRTSDLHVKFDAAGASTKAPMPEYLPFFDLLTQTEELRQFCLELNVKKDKTQHDHDELARLLAEPQFKKIREQLEQPPYGSFGKVFEMAIGAKILDIIKNLKPRHYVSELVVSQVVTFDDANTPVDEFDIVLLTRDGKFIIFECKTGSMHSDVAKSTRYSAYAVGGVYGLPILLVPLRSEERKVVPPFAENLKGTIKAAERAQLAVWGLDEIEPNLKNKLMP